MGNLPGIIIPDVKPLPAKDIAEWGEFLRQWREDYAAGRETIPPPENAVFFHDEHWRDNWLSIQAAYERKHLVWKIVGGLFATSSVLGSSYAVMGMRH